MKSVKQKVDIALSDKDVLSLVEGNAVVRLYKDLARFNTIDEALGKHGALFLLYETQPDYGHWVAVIKRQGDNGPEIEYFDSYGGYVDGTLKYVPKYFRKVSGQNFPHLSALMYNSPYDLAYNQYKFQKHGANIKTCGRWSALRIIFRDLPLETFKRLFKHANSDELVTMLTTPDLDY